MRKPVCLYTSLPAYLGGYVGILFTDVGLSILVESFGGSQKRENAKSLMQNQTGSNLGNKK